MPKEKIKVTQPSLPDLKDFIPYLEDIWDSKWLTNNGKFHQKLEKELADFLGVKYISLFNNGTSALMVALKALDITGEVITTPYSFVATSNVIVWNNCKPVFCDIEPKTMNIDPEKIEALITPQTTAIMPVHVYGIPCENTKIELIAKKHNLKVIYDAAHAFGVKKDGETILNWGDLSVLSFHATKVFNTLEGGAIISHKKEMKEKIDRLKNFGFVNETTIAEIGINGKMNELQAAFGLMQLKNIKDNISKRKKIAEFYRQSLDNISGIEYLQIEENVDWNYAYFPIFVNEKEYGMSRDQVYEKLKQNNIYGRRYFYPLISEFSMYKGLDSAKPENLPVAHKMANEVICLPIYPELAEEMINKIIYLIKNLYE
jgi:dTDP-4-amino-4,6-dideoxygalactose transaminase